MGAHGDAGEGQLGGHPGARDHLHQPDPQVRHAAGREKHPVSGVTSVTMLACPTFSTFSTFFL